MSELGLKERGPLSRSGIRILVGMASRLANSALVSHHDRAIALMRSTGAEIGMFLSESRGLWFYL